MSLNQISVFLENKPGKLQALTDILAGKAVNMRALSLAEASDFGIVRIIADDLDAAAAVLKEEGYIHTITKVVGVAIPDEPGGLNNVLKGQRQCGIHVRFPGQKEHRPRLHDLPRAGREEGRRSAGGKRDCVRGAGRTDGTVMKIRNSDPFPDGRGSLFAHC